MSDALKVLLFVWLVGTVGAVALGSTSLTSFGVYQRWQREKRRFWARFILTCWAWPIWLLGFTGIATYRVIKIATQEPK